MSRDRYYQKIVEGLQGNLDTKLFEDCAADLLRRIYPGLVPVPGGADAGMDGAIGSTAFLIATTNKRVLSNLTKNLNSHLKDGDNRNDIVIATSQSLNARNRLALEKRATELGFNVLGIHDQTDIANGLYRDSRWTKALLNLTGEPPALSEIPKSERPFLDIPLVGRDEDLRWLRETPGDKMLLGQPGLGKTFLLHQLAKEGIALFVNTDDRTQIAEAVREERPRILIVDDAQLKHDLLLELKQIRADVYGEFTIIVTAWPSHQAQFTEILNTPSAQVRTLDLLPRDDIVRIIKSVGIEGPNPFVRELVDQAEGRPGLAVTLADLSLKGDWRQVALGDVLSQSLLKYFSTTIGIRATHVLAAFSIGGERGMKTDVVASELGMSLSDLGIIVTELATGGIITELERGRLSVRPIALREALVRDTFFRSPVPLPYERLVWQAPSIGEVARTFIGAIRRGAVIPVDFMTQILEATDGQIVWRQYASLGRDEALWVLANHPEQLINIAFPLLYYAPEVAIPRLLTAAIGDNRPLNSATNHPLRMIADWIQSGEPGIGEGLRSRQVLLDAASTWLRDAKDVTVWLAVLKDVFSPHFEKGDTDPGAGNVYTLRYGYLSLNELQAIQAMWPQALQVMQQITIGDWEPLHELTTTWAYPGRGDIVLPNELSESMRAFAGQVLRDIVSLSNKDVQVAYWARQVAKHLGLDLEIYIDRDFEVLYPNRDVGNWQAEEAAQRQAVRELALEWSQREPTEVSQRIASVESDARHAKAHWPRWAPLLRWEIASHVTFPNSWAEAMILAGNTSDLVSPFLERAAALDEAGWVETANMCLDGSQAIGAVVNVALTHPSPPAELLARVLQNLKGFGSIIQTLCIRNQVPEATLKQLLAQQDAEIAQAAAWGEWFRGPAGHVRESLVEEWRDAILRTTDDDHLLREVFSRDSALAFEWVQRRLSRKPLDLYRNDEVWGAALGSLGVNERRAILHSLPAEYGAQQLVAGLVGNDMELYGELLNDQRLKAFHLVPLGGNPEGIWIEKAKLALDAGCDAEEIAHAAFGYPSALAWTGDESKMWAQWVERFDLLCSDPDARIQKIGQLGRAYALERQSEARRQERREAIYGRF